MKKTLLALVAFAALSASAQEAAPSQVPVPAAVPVVQTIPVPEGASPEAVLHYLGSVAVSANASATEQTRLRVLAAIASGSDARTRDRVVAELERSSAPAVPAVAGYQAPTPLWLQALGVLANPMATLAGAKISADTQVKLGEQSVTKHGIIFGTLGGIAAGTADLGAAAINKLPSVSISGTAFGSFAAE